MKTKILLTAAMLCTISAPTFAELYQYCSEMVEGECPSYCIESSPNDTTTVLLYTVKSLNSKCNKLSSYTVRLICATGYYGNPELANPLTGEVVECTECPDGGTTAGQGATNITECYIPSGTTGSDASGSYTLTSDCYYTE